MARNDPSLQQIILDEVRGLRADNKLMWSQVLQNKEDISNAKTAIRIFTWIVGTFGLGSIMYMLRHIGNTFNG